MIRAAAACFAALALLAAVPQEHRFGIGDWSRIVQLSSAVISPDGTQIAFDVSRADMANNRYDDTLEVYDRRTHTLRALASGHRVVDTIRWSPSGAQIAAVMDAPGEDADQLYVIDPGTGEARRLTSGESDVDAIDWSPSGDAIAFTRRDAAPHLTGEASYRDGFEVTDNAYLVTSAPRRRGLWVVDLSGRERRLPVRGGSVASDVISWSRDGKRILYERAPDAVSAHDELATVMALNVSDAVSTPAGARRAYEDNGLFSPDGSRVAYRVNRDGDPMNQPEAYVDGHDVSRMLDRHVEVFAWMPKGNALLLEGFSETQQPLWVQPLHGRAHRLPLGAVVQARIEPQDSVARDGTIGFIGRETGRPDEIYVLPPGAKAPQRLTSLNDAIAAMPMGRTITISWRSGSLRPDGVVIYPVGYTRGKKYPMVLWIHGGPALSGYSAFRRMTQALASRGYVVFEPNYRGSNNLGNAFEHAIYNDAGAGPGRDIMAGIRAVEKLGIVDSSRIGVSGWSYGGQMTSWMEAQYPIFKSAVAWAAVNDLTVDYATADDIVDDRNYMGGSPYRANVMERYRAQSPITYYRRIRTPTLIMGNVYDVRVPIVESYEMYHALLDNGVPVKFYAFPTHEHLPQGPVRMAQAFSLWYDWFDRYLK
ncbi:MAG TPA: S9 family peptidase [Candidatus Baltobacteraceae bacterium]|nr:S9 family peptidase [Candidatus Baltobacteraceae bacterium]